MLAVGFSLSAFIMLFHMKENTRPLQTYENRVRSHRCGAGHRRSTSERLAPISGCSRGSAELQLDCAARRPILAGPLGVGNVGRMAV